MVVISNSSPLIFLARIKKLELLRNYFNEIYIPKKVYEEVCMKGKDKPGSEEIKRADFIKVVEIKNKLAAELLGMEIEGESEVIVLAKEMGASLVIIDDKLPRRILETLGFDVVGTIGILMKASRDKLIDLKSALKELKKKGFWISDEDLDYIVEKSEK